MRGFSWKRATGISGIKGKIARKTGIPTTKAGRDRKWGFWPILSRMGKDGRGDDSAEPSGCGCTGCLCWSIIVFGGVFLALKYLLR